MCLCVTGIYCFATTDVLFLVDSTGSMNGLLIFQAAFNDIIDAIEADSCPENIMYSIADYRNRSDGGNYTAYGVNLDQPFTKSALEAQLAISGLTAAGGGDEEESQLKAFISIVDNWLTSSGDLGFGGRSEAKKMIIWAGDQPGHDKADDIYYPALNTVINSLTAQGIVVFALNPSGYHSGLDALYNGHYQASEITTSTGGTLFNNA